MSDNISVRKIFALVRVQHTVLDAVEHVILGLYDSREAAEAEVLLLFRGRFEHLSKTRIVEYPIGTYLPQRNMSNYEAK